MEDSHFAKSKISKDIEDINIFGVLDGHGGKEVSAFVERHFVNHLISTESFMKGQYTQSLQETFLHMDVLLRDPCSKNELMQLSGKFSNPQIDSSKFNSIAGCTACIALMVKNKLYVANSGDARCVICTDSEAVQITVDHNPELKSEIERIYKAGGKISRGRVEGYLNLTRAIGDLQFKKNSYIAEKDQIISVFPDVFERELISGDEFLVLGCDGVYDNWTNQEIVDFIRTNMQKEEKLSGTIERLFDEIIAKDINDPKNQNGAGFDNMSCIVVSLNEKDGHTK